MTASRRTPRQPAGRRKIRWSRVALYVVLVVGRGPLPAAGLHAAHHRHEELPGGEPGPHVGSAVGLHFDSFLKAWFGNPTQGVRGLTGNFMNSVYLAIPATLISAFLGSMNGYVLSKWKFPGANIVFPLLLFGMFIPYQSILIPLVRVLQVMGLYGSIPGLIFVHIVYGIPITTLIFRNYYAAIPNELIEASKIDGAGLLRHLPPHPLPDLDPRLRRRHDLAVHVGLERLPLRRHRHQPAHVQPITVALNNMAGSYIVEWNVQMAGAILAALPTLLVYIFLGRYFMRGLLAGSVKG